MSAMQPTRRSLLAGMAAVAAASHARAQPAALPEFQRHWLWPVDAIAAPAGLNFAVINRQQSGQPLDRAFRGVVRPFLDILHPAVPNGAAVILMPGGGYRHLAVDKEGYEPARWFAARGITTAVLVYRLPTEGWAGGGDVPLADAQRAVRLLRSGSLAATVAPNRIAVLGFSAGGHLATNLAARSDRLLPPASAAEQAISARPDLVGALYPATLLDQLGSALPPGEGLFGPAGSVDEHLPHRHVPANPPPHILVHAEDDPLVGPEHSLALRAALRARGGTVSTHLYPAGGHGFGLRLPAGSPLAAWPEQFLAFGRSTGWLT